MKPCRGGGSFAGNLRSCEVEKLKDIREMDSEKMGERARSCKKSNNDDDFEHSIVLKTIF